VELATELTVPAWQVEVQLNSSIRVAEASGWSAPPLLPEPQPPSINAPTIADKTREISNILFRIYAFSFHRKLSFVTDLGLSAPCPGTESPGLLLPFNDRMNRFNRLQTAGAMAIHANGDPLCADTRLGVLRIEEGVEQLRARGQIQADEEVIVFNTGAAQKYPETVPLDLPRLDKNRAIDYDRLVGPL
jgi:hypothetical protein